MCQKGDEYVAQRHSIYLQDKRKKEKVKRQKSFYERMEKDIRDREEIKIV